MKISGYEFGDPQGKPVLFFHGFPGSGKEAKIMDRDAKALGYRIFSFDRPGYGETDPAWEMDYPSYYDKILSLIPSSEKLRVVGVSGGGPYASDFAHRRHSRVQALYLVCPLAGLKHPEVLNSYPKRLRNQLRSYSLLPKALKTFFFKAATVVRGKPEKFFPKFIQKLPLVDQESFKDLEFRNIMRQSYLTARMQQMRGCVSDLHFYMKWEPSKDISKDIKIYLYHGTVDSIVPHKSSEIYLKILPSAKLSLSEDGHFSLPLTKNKEIFRDFEND